MQITLTSTLRTSTEILQRKSRRHKHQVSSIESVLQSFIVCLLKFRYFAANIPTKNLKEQRSSFSKWKIRDLDPYFWTSIIC